MLVEWLWRCRRRCVRKVKKTDCNGCRSEGSAAKFRDEKRWAGYAVRQTDGCHGRDGAVA